MTIFQIEVEQEVDGRWIAEIEALPGAICYGTSRQDAMIKVVALALRIVADRLEHGEDL
jgi:predicted RNase H-like HicB family nuclease